MRQQRVVLKNYTHQCHNRYTSTQQHHYY